MASTYELISSVTVGAGGASAITFTSISSSYTDLILKVSARCDYAATATDFWINFNGTASALSTKLLFGTGSTAASSGESSRTNVWAMNIPGTSSTSNTFMNGEYYIPNYTSSNNKSFNADSVTENNATSALAMIGAGLYSNTSAISSITLTPAGGSLVQYSTAYLYGVKNA